MELFSKRNRRNPLIRRSRFRTETENQGFLEETLRTRLQFVIKSLATSGGYFEKFLEVLDKAKDQRYLCDETLQNLSTGELGYDLTLMLNCRNLTYTTATYADERLFDLIEILIIFSLDLKQDEVIYRFKDVFEEEGAEFLIQDFMIVPRSPSGLASITPLIKDRELKLKMEEYLAAVPASSGSYQHIAQIVAGITQLLFSGVDKSDTKKYSEDLCKKVAEKWTTTDRVEELSEKISNTIKNIKDLNNDIFNIRHTDKSSIPVSTPSFYKMITTQNLSIIELVINSLPEKYILTQDAKSIKTGYLKKFCLEKHTGWVVENKIDDEINIDDIPF